jgi:hypothetical protein
VLLHKIYLDALFVNWFIVCYVHAYACQRQMYGCIWRNNLKMMVVLTLWNRLFTTNLFIHVWVQKLCNTFNEMFWKWPFYYRQFFPTYMLYFNLFFNFLKCFFPTRKWLPMHLKKSLIYIQDAKLELIVFLMRFKLYIYILKQFFVLISFVLWSCLNPFNHATFGTIGKPSMT